MADSGPMKTVELFVQVPAAATERQFLLTVDVPISPSLHENEATQPTYEEVAYAVVKSDPLPSEARFYFLRDDGAAVENWLTERVPGKEVILKLARASGVERPRAFPRVILSEHPRAHAPSVCQNISSGAELSIPVIAASGTAIECYMPRQKALDLGLRCLLEDAHEGLDYFGLINCKIPPHMMLHGVQRHEGLQSLLHVYCGKEFKSDTSFFANLLIIGFPGMKRLKIGLRLDAESDPDHPKPCPYECCRDI